MHESKELLTLEIQDLSRGGPGVARDENGRVIFVPFTMPGDKVCVEIVSVEKRYAEARLLEILTPSPRRVEAKCSVFSRCGGCDWQHMPYDLQWQTKLAGIKHAMKRTGVEYTKNFLEIPAEQIWNYRNRVQLRGFGNALGFYGKGTKELVAIDECAIAREEINRELPKLREEGRGRAREYKLEVDVSADGNTVRSFWNQGHAAGGFRQIHDGQNAKLQAWVKEKITAGNVVLDLYGGSGNLSLPIASQQSAIYSVDVGAPLNKPEGTPDHLRFYRQPVLPWLEARVSEQRQGKFLWPKEARLSAVIDPSREGLGAEWFEIVNALKALGVVEILAIGCDVDAWVRDVFHYVKHGWQIVELGAIDLFPQTHHVESLALLRKI